MERIRGVDGPAVSTAAPSTVRQKLENEAKMASSLRPLALLGAFVVGYLFPQGAALDWALPWFVRFMLFAVFLKLEFPKARLRRSHWAILALNLGVAVVGCEVFRLFDAEMLALTAFFTAIAPTATAAPAVGGFLKRDVEYVVVGLLLSTLGVAVALPTLLPWVLGKPVSGAFLGVATNVGSVVVVPIIVARIVRALYPASRTWTDRLKNVTFGAWVAMVTIIAAKATTFVADPANGVRPTTLLEIGALSLVVCVLNFGLGYLVGERDFRQEASQTLGQKNTGAAIYFAALYADPLVALGPTLYVFWHNVWNATQLEMLALKERKAKKAAENAAARAESGV